MPRRELARRMGLSAKRVIQLEQGEAEGRVTMEALRRAAVALDCELVVALVPRRPLEETVNARREQLVNAWLQTNALHTVAIEGQAVSVSDLPRSLIREIEDRFPDEPMGPTVTSADIAAQKKRWRARNGALGNETWTSVASGRPCTAVHDNLGTGSQVAARSTDAAVSHIARLT